MRETNPPDPAAPQLFAEGATEPEPPAQLPALSLTPDLPAFARSLRRCWLLALGAGLALAAAVGPAVWWFMPDAKYTAEGTVIIRMNPPIVSNPFRGNPGDPKTYQKTQLAMLQDRSVLAHALASPKAVGLPSIERMRRGNVDPEEWLAENLKADYSGGSEILKVSLSGDDPRDLATIVNAVVESYMVLVVAAERKERQDRLNKLVELRGRYEADLTARRNGLAGVVEAIGSHDTGSLAVAQQFAASHLSSAQAELTRTEAELLRLRADLAALEAPAGEPRPGAGAAPAAATPAAPAVAPRNVEELVARAPTVLPLAEAVSTAARQYREVDRVVRSKSDPALERALRRWQGAYAALEAERQAVRQALLSGQNVLPAGAGAPPAPPAAGPDDQRDLARLRAQVRLLEEHRASRAAELARLEEGLKKLSRGSLEVEADREAIDVAADFARKVGLEIEAVKAEVNEPDRIRVFTPAKPPMPRDKYRKAKGGGAAGAAAFALAALGVTYLEFRARRVSLPDDVGRGLGIRLFGALPVVPAAVGSSDRGRPWQGLLADSIDTTRTRLLHADRSRPVRVVMVTSAVQGEGKTSLATHLAASLGRAGRTTLLVDCDLRRPAIHRLLDLPQSPGLSEALSDGVPVDDLVQPTGLEGLGVITAGRCDPAALQGLARDDLRGVLDCLRRRYDYIILDAPPVQPVVDALLIAQHADGVLFSVLRNVSRAPLIHTAYNRLAGLGANMLGAVVSGVPLGWYGHAADYYSEGGTRPSPAAS
jgi:capsular exopolysaccharide synthesis family protein